LNSFNPPVQDPNLNLNPNPNPNPNPFGPPITPRDVRAAFKIEPECSTSTSTGPGSEQSPEQGEDIKTKLDKLQGREDHPLEQHIQQHDMVKLNAFEIISSLSPGFDLRRLFEMDPKESLFTTAKPPAVVISRFEEVAKMERFLIEKNGEGMVQLRSSKEGRKGQLTIDAEIFEVAPTLHVVEVKKVAGDTIEYNDFCNQDLRPALRDIVWTWQEHQPKPGQVVN